MRARELERLLIEHGVGKAKVDMTTRQLRESGRLPTGGRGPNAPAIGPSEAAIILIAVAGSGKAIEADVRVEKLTRLRSTRGHRDRTLLDAVATYIANPLNLANVSEVRIARTTRRAAVHYRDGAIEEFLPSGRESGTDSFLVEGILSRRLLEIVARAIGANDENASSPEL